MIKKRMVLLFLCCLGAQAMEGGQAFQDISSLQGAPRLIEEEKKGSPTQLSELAAPLALPEQGSAASSQPQRCQEEEKGPAIPNAPQTPQTPQTFGYLEPSLADFAQKKLKPYPHLQEMHRGIVNLFSDKWMEIECHHARVKQSHQGEQPHWLSPQETVQGLWNQGGQQLHAFFLFLSKQFATDFVRSKIEDIEGLASVLDTKFGTYKGLQELMKLCSHDACEAPECVYSHSLAANMMRTLDLEPNPKEMQDFSNKLASFLSKIAANTFRLETIGKDLDKVQKSLQHLLKNYDKSKIDDIEWMVDQALYQAKKRIKKHSIFDAMRFSKADKKKKTLVVNPGPIQELIATINKKIKDQIPNAGMYEKGYLFVRDHIVEDSEHTTNHITPKKNARKLKKFLKNIITAAKSKNPKNYKKLIKTKRIRKQKEKRAFRRPQSGMQTT